VRALTEAEIGRSMVNCSRSETASIALPRDFAELDRAVLDVLGWRDPKAELRGYLAHERDAERRGIALRAAEELQAAAVDEQRTALAVGWGRSPPTSGAPEPLRERGPASRWQPRPGSCRYPPSSW
jgi:hypothetical protein